MKKHHKNNQGYSLVELIVVIAIISVLAGLSMVGLHWIQGKPALKCAHMIKSSLCESQALSMAKYETAILIRRNEEGKLELRQSHRDTKADEECVVSVVEIGNSDVDVSFVTDSGEEYEIDETQSLTLFFNRMTGGFLPLENTSEYCYEIHVSKAGTEKIVELAPLTGSISLK